MQSSLFDPSLGNDLTSTPYHIKDQLIRVQKTKDMQDRLRIKEEALARLKAHRGEINATEMQPYSDDNKQYLSPPPPQKRNSLNRNKPVFHGAHITLEQLRNIQDPKDLFSKEDEDKFNMILGIDPESPIHNRTPLK